MRTSEHRTVSYVYGDDLIVGSVEWEPEGNDGRWAVRVTEADGTGTVVDRAPDRGAGLVLLGAELTRRCMAKTVVEVLTS